MRARDIKPGFFKNDVLAECDPFARLLFIGLWMLADREGRLECRPRKIKAEILPYDNCDVEALLGELEAKGFIVTYVAEGVKCVWIPKFSKHQRPHQNEVPSTIPPYEERSPSPQGMQDLSPRSEALATKVESACDQGFCEVPSTDEALRPSSLTPSSLTPSSLTPDIPPLTPPEGGVRAEELEQPSLVPDAPKKTRAKKTTLSRPEDFDEFWDLYPRKTDKEGARRAWDKLERAGELPGQKVLLAAITWRRAYWRDHGTEEEHIPHASTWLNRKRWEDEMPAPIQARPRVWAPAQPRLPPEQQAMENNKATMERVLARMKAEREGKE